MKRFLKYLICVYVILSTASGYVFADGGSWYVMRNKDHLQPAADRQFDFIKDHNCVYVDKSASDEKVIYLTFDAGYENGNISIILDTLKEHNAPGNFFILENLIKREPELVQRMCDEGHLVCNHTAKHKDMSKCHDELTFRHELESLEKQYFELTGEDMAKFYRPPEGKFTEENLRFADDMGYCTVLWSFAYADWNNDKQPECKDALLKILDNVHNGEIMLLHPTSSTNAAILDELLTKLEGMGYRFASLEELKCVS